MGKSPIDPAREGPIDRRRDETTGIKGREIRRQARRMAGEHRGFFALLALEVQLPIFLIRFLASAAAWKGWSIPLLPLKVLYGIAVVMSRGLTLCLMGAALSMAQTGARRRLTGVLRDGGWRRVLATTLVRMAFFQILWWSFGPIRAQGRWVALAGSLLYEALVLVFTTALFPVGYLLFLAPKKSVGTVFRDGIQVGFRFFWSILVFDILLNLPLSAWRALIGFLRLVLVHVLLVIEPTVGVMAEELLFLAVELWFAAYVELGAALHGLELLGSGEDGPVRRMRLVHRGGWYYRHHEKGPVRPGPLERK